MTPIERRHWCKLRVGYGAEDVPMEPRRSAYTADSAGTGAFFDALQRWSHYIDLCEVYNVDPHGPTGRS